MKLIESQAALLQQPEGLEGVYKQIELCGRTCYKSTDRMTEDSAKPFVDRMIASKHTAMLEHGTVYLKIPRDVNSRNIRGKYSKHWLSPTDYLLTTNLRRLVEKERLDLLQYLCEPTEHHEKRYTLRFTTDRGVSHELVRHRVFSFAQESTRYCNYSKDKFGNEVTFIKPSWYDAADRRIQLDFESTLDWTESTYLGLLKEGLTPQQARQVLPNALKTEVCMTGFASDWRFFFDLRYYGETGKPHPDMELLASKAREELIKAGVWDDIMKYPSRFDKDDTEGEDN